MTGRRMLLFLSVSAAIGLVPATAGAADYCVGNTACGGTPVADLEQALDFADNDTNADRVFLDATTYTAQTATGFYYSESSSPVEIIGQGRGRTGLTAPSAASFVLRLIGGPGTSVRDLTISLPQPGQHGDPLRDWRRHAAALDGVRTGRRLERVRRHDRTFAPDRLEVRDRGLPRMRRP